MYTLNLSRLIIVAALAACLAGCSDGNETKIESADSETQAQKEQLDTYLFEPVRAAAACISVLEKPDAKRVLLIGDDAMKVRGVFEAAGMKCQTNLSGKVDIAFVDCSSMSAQSRDKVFSCISANGVFAWLMDVRGVSAQAFREACLLYPASPEATFRYLQECLIPMRRWDVVFELLDYTDKIDPKNRRTKSLRDPLMKMIAADKEARALEEKRRSGKLPVRDAVKLADIYIQSGRARDSAQVVREVADDMTDAESLGFAWQVLLAARFDSDAEKVLVRYVKLNPGDYHAWAELAKLQNRAGRREEAVQSFITGCRVNQQAMLQKIQQDRELYEIAAPMLQRRK
jgi:thioredoxin-like negative regulator of GroEL